MQDLKEKAQTVGRLLEEHKADKVSVIDISRLNSWTDFFVIATVTSPAHGKGLYKHVKDYAKDSELEIHLTKHKIADGDDWNIIDLGGIVVHLMSQEARTFYDLEKLWHEGEKII